MSGSGLMLLLAWWRIPAWRWLSLRWKAFGCSTEVPTRSSCQLVSCMVSILEPTSRFQQAGAGVQNHSVRRQPYQNTVDFVNMSMKKWYKGNHEVEVVMMMVMMRKMLVMMRYIYIIHIYIYIYKCIDTDLYMYRYRYIAEIRSLWLRCQDLR